MNPKNRKQANTLITVLSVLFVLSTLAVSFAKISTGEMNASKNYSESIRVNFIAEAGLQYGAARLANDFRQKLYLNFTDYYTNPNPESDWAYKLSGNIPGDTDIIDVNSAAGVPLEQAQTQFASGSFPVRLSYRDNSLNFTSDVIKRQFSGTLKKVDGVPVENFTLKILDTSSQIDLLSLLDKAEVTGPPTVKAIDSHMKMPIELKGAVENDEKGITGPNDDNTNRGILNNLSRSIAFYDPGYSLEFGDQWGPLYAQVGTGGSAKFYSFATEIVEQQRDNSGLLSTKFDLLKIEHRTKNTLGGTKAATDKPLKLDPNKLKYLWDYVTINSGQTQQMVVRNKAIMGDTDTPVPYSRPTVEAYRTESASPININTAPMPVLVALFWGLKYIAPDDMDNDSTNALGRNNPSKQPNNDNPTNPGVIEINRQEAEEIAATICKRRGGTSDPASMFTTWSDFQNQLLAFADFQSMFTATANAANGAQADDTAKKLRRKKALMVYANSETNTILRRLNPDATAYQEINRTDLEYYTLPICFYPQGNFEITSLGQIFNNARELVVQSKAYCQAKVFFLQKKTAQSSWHSTQKDVINGLSIPRQGNHSYSAPNNIQTNRGYTETSEPHSSSMGYIQPVIFDYQYGEAALDTTGVTFKCNYNLADQDPTLYRPFSPTFPASSTLITSGLPLGMQPKGPDSDDTTELFVAVPQVFNDATSISFSDLVPDGVVFWDENPATDVVTHQKMTLCYEANPHLPDANPLNVPLNDNGILMFWFKLNDQGYYSPVAKAKRGEPGEDGYRTIFFATSPWSSTEGIQMRIRMRFDQELGELRVEAERRYYDTLGTSICPFTKKSYKLEYTFESIADVDEPSFAVKPHEWYHLAVRWKDGTDMDFSTVGVSEKGIVLSGNFYRLDPTTGRLKQNREVIPTDDLVNGNVYNSTGSSIYDASPTVDLVADITTPIDAVEQAASGTTGRIFIGATPNNAQGRVDSIAMTIDDVRIIDGNTDKVGGDFKPSRYSTLYETNDGTNTYAVKGTFVGSFRNGDFQTEADEVVLGVMDYTIRSLTANDPSTPATIFNLPSGAMLDDESESQHAAYDVSILINELGNDGDRTYFNVRNDVWKKVYDDVLDNSLPGSKGMLSLTDFVQTYGEAIMVIWETRRGTKLPLDGLTNKNQYGGSYETAFDTIENELFAPKTLTGNHEQKTKQLLDALNTRFTNALAVLNPPRTFPLDAKPDPDPVPDPDPDPGHGTGDDLPPLPPVPNGAAIGSGITVLANGTDFDFLFQFRENVNPLKPLAPEYYATVIDDVIVSFQQGSIKFSQKLLITE